MYDELIEQDPKMKRIRAESEARGRSEGFAKGRSKGRIEGLQEAVVAVISGRFPSLVELAQSKVTTVTKIDALDLVLQAMSKAPDETTARLLLEALLV